MWWEGICHQIRSVHYWYILCFGWINYCFVWTTVSCFVGCETNNKLRHFILSSGIHWHLNIKQVGSTDSVKELQYMLWNKAQQHTSPMQLINNNDKFKLHTSRLTPLILDIYVQLRLNFVMNSQCHVLWVITATKDFQYQIRFGWEFRHSWSVTNVDEYMKIRGKRQKKRSGPLRGVLQHEQQDPAQQPPILHVR